MFQNVLAQQTNIQSVNILVRQTNIPQDSFVLTGLIEAAAIPFSGIKIEELSLDEKAEILFVDQAYVYTLALFVWFLGYSLYMYRYLSSPLVMIFPSLSIVASQLL